MSAVVHVNNISSQTSEQQVRDFFSFCGKITSLTVTPDSAAPDAPKKATVTFEKETAAKTALLLDNTQLGPSQVTVTAGSSLSEIAGAAGGAAAAAGESPYDENHIPQEEKPRSRIFAEYLAHGYTIGDKALEQALALDQKHGISNKFTQTLQNYNEKYNVTEKARAMDQNYGVSNKGLQAWAGLHSYFEKAVNTPTGQRLVDFYSNANQQVIDIHNEARRLADIRAGKDPKTAGPTGMSTEEATRHNEETKTAVPGTNKTVCQCAGNDGTCACKSGECACSGCAKSGIQGDHTATGQADVVGATAAIQPLPEKSV